MARLAWMALAVLLASCATTAGYEKILNSWVGREEIDLVRTWGPPLQTYETAGRKFLSYSSEKMVYRPASPGIVHTTRLGNGAYSSRVLGGVGSSLTHFSCQTVFELDGTKVVSWTHNGNACKADD